MRADEVIVIDADGDEVQVQVPAPEATSLSIKREHEDIPQDSDKPAEPALRRSTRVWPLDLSCSIIRSFPNGTEMLITRRKFVPKIWRANLCRWSPPNSVPSMPLVVDVAGNCNPPVLS